MDQRIIFPIALLVAVFACNAAAQADKRLSLQEEEAALMRNPDNITTEVFEAESDEYKVRVYRLFLKVPERTAPKVSQHGPPARSANMVVTRFRLEVAYRIATSDRRQAWTEAMLLGADPTEVMKIDREICEAESDIEGKPTTAKLRYFAGTTLIASQDLTSDTMQSRSALARISKLGEWAQAKSDKK